MLKYYDDVRQMRDVGSRRRNEFEFWQHLLEASSPGAEERIRGAINEFVDVKVRQEGWTSDCWFCSSFIPGADWTNTPYQPIFDAMCERYGEEPAWNQSRLFFGLLVKDVMVRRSEHWLCYKVPEEEEIEKGTNYFPDFSEQAMAGTNHCRGEER